MRKYQFNITRDDILKGKVGHPRQCAVARGIQRRFPKLNPLVGPVLIRLNNSKGITVKTPKKTSTFINGFDRIKKRDNRLKKVSPFRFCLYLPDWVRGYLKK